MCAGDARYERTEGERQVYHERLVSSKVRLHQSLFILLDVADRRKSFSYRGFSFSRLQQWP